MADARSRPRVLEIVEASVASLSFLWLLANPGVRALFGICVFAVLDGTRSAALLVSVDHGTIGAATLAGLRIILLVAPVARALVHARRHRLAWVPILSLIFAFVLGTSVPALHGWFTWLVFLAATALAWFAASRPRLRFAAFLPWLVALEPMFGHGPWSDRWWPPSRLEKRCAGNDGVRPINLGPSNLVARHYSVTPQGDWMLLAGEGGNYWIERVGGVARISEKLPISGNFWQGCVRDGVAWITSRQMGLCEQPFPTHGGPIPKPRCHPAPGAASLGVELDYVDPICPPDRPTVYASQLVRGGYLELDPRDDTTKFHPVIDGLNLQLVPRKDGKLLGITTSRFVVFDPDADRVLEEHPAGIVAMGIDVCSTDDAVVITDFTGRLRLFERGADGRYAFRAATSISAPRRVAFSPTCDRIAVTSGDDRHAWLIRRSDLQTLRTYTLGPGLREQLFLDDKTLASVDACTVSFLDASP
ncbi:MAG: hypothetical protein ACXWUE_17640 [Polyangiales bacterium]